MGWTRRLARRELLLDVLLWGVLCAPIAWALLSPPHRPWDWLRLTGALLVMALAVLASRRAPLVSMVLVVLCTTVDGNFVFAIPVLSYLVGSRMSRAGPAALVFGVIAVGGSVMNLGLLGSDPEIWYLTANTLIFGGILPWLVGRYRRQQRALALAGWEHAELLEREQRGAAERVRMRERARIAQDIHDSLGHDLSLIALRAGALELAAGLDERHRRAAGELRASVALATERLRQVIGVLREDADGAPIWPAGEGIGDLVERARAAGMPVRLRTGTGEESAQAGPLATEPGAAAAPTADAAAAGPGAVAPMVDRVAYRVVQEALTNANRHAPGAEVTVSVSTAAGRTLVRVVNAPPPAGTPPVSRSGGSGLLGLREWVRQVGGTLRVGPVDGGFEVFAELPHDPTGAAPSSGWSAVDPSTAGETPPTVARSGAAERLRLARRRARRSLVAAVAVPAAIGSALALAYYPLATAGTELPADRFDQLRIGQSRAELRGVLPRRQHTAPNLPAGYPTPAGASCEYYSDGGFPMGRVAYRLCFRDGRLVVKDRLPD